ncbi:MAG: hypothetical protein QM778_21465 [Myxococcales bacterium]
MSRIRRRTEVRSSSVGIDFRSSRRPRARFDIWALLALSVCLTDSTIAQDNDDWDNSGDSQPAQSRPRAQPKQSRPAPAPAPASDVCEPECRRGYACVRSECLPTCDRGCPDGTICSEGGVCVQTQKPPQSTTRASAWTEEDPNQCYPDCRSGFTCIRGQCVSKCNPVCFDGEICTDQGECVLRPVEESEGKKKKPDKFKDSIANLSVDVLGGFQFGITPTIEVGKKLSGYLRLRPLNTGLLSYYLLDRNQDDFQWGIGAAAGMHIFSAGKGNLRGLFGGPALEYVFVKTRDGAVDRATYGTHALIPQFDVGYRWGFSRLSIGVGGRVGLSVPVAGYQHPINPNGCPDPQSCSSDRNLYFVAGVFLDIGIFL